MGSKQNTSELHTIISGLMRQLESKDHMIEHLMEKVDSLEKTIKGQSRDIQKMAGIISTYERRLFGTSSEKTHRDQVEEIVEEDDIEEDDEDSNPKGSFYYIPGKLCKVKLDRYVYSKDGHLITPKLPYVPETLEKRHASPNLPAKSTL